ncbi:MAG TPA: cytochrome d ubiquinol oxidase subunit II [Candidatus Limnocylindrales bacterium]|nr:cytochrome d ubiquinol oxidase subunit II [Candidatus Limnocylindrales bacterium]
MELTTIWFALIAVLFIGYFILEGFDYGVGIMLRVIGRNEPERRAMIRTIGPVWDGNEVWLIVAGGAMFAAFPEWYATLFSGFYLALFLILVALILRGVGIEYRNKRGDLAWRSRMDAMITVGSFLPALLWGVAFANIVQGVPIDADKHFTGSLITLLNPFGLLGGLTTLLLFVTHGLLYLTLKTEGEIRERARRLTLPVGLVTAVVAVAFLLWANAIRGDMLSTAVAVLAAVAWLAGLGAAWVKREGVAFFASALTIGLAVVSLFLALFPDVMPSTTDPAFSLTTTNAASTPYTLTIMTVVAVIFVPIVLIYQGWTYYVFRKRVTTPRAGVEA